MCPSCFRYVFCFVITETLCCLFLTIIKLMLFKNFNSASRYLDVLLKIDNPYFKNWKVIYPTKLKLNKANSFDIEAFGLGLVHNNWHSFIEKL